VSRDFVLSFDGIYIYFACLESLLHNNFAAGSGMIAVGSNLKSMTSHLSIVIFFINLSRDSCENADVDDPADFAGWWAESAAVAVAAAVAASLASIGIFKIQYARFFIPTSMLIILIGCSNKLHIIPFICNYSIYMK
jgi:hypothetical protein